MYLGRMGANAAATLWDKANKDPAAALFGSRFAALTPLGSRPISLQCNRRIEVFLHSNYGRCCRRPVSEARNGSVSALVALAGICAHRRRHSG